MNELNILERITDQDSFKRETAALQKSEGYRAPKAFAVGFVYCANDGSPLSVYFPTVNATEENGGSASVFQLYAKQKSPLDGSSAVVEIDRSMIDSILKAFKPFEEDGKLHSNIDALKMVRSMAGRARFGGSNFKAVFVFIYDLDAPPQGVEDMYLRLYLLSTRKAKPNTINLDTVFGILPTCHWTKYGPVSEDDFYQANMRHIMEHGESLQVTSKDKFPRMSDYMETPKDVRVANPNSVRLGAYLGTGTVVMYAGGINFNSGTLGKAMVEGRIPIGVVVGKDCAIGGGASILGTTSGGGKHVVSIGERCLVGANGGTGISLGNDCRIEAGLYITVHTCVYKPDGKMVRAADLSGQDSMTFYRGHDGKVYVVQTKGDGIKLNDALHGTSH